MGAEVRCAVGYRGKTAIGKVRLETGVLQIRGAELKLDVPFVEMKKVVARNGALSFSHRNRPITVAVGSSAEKWADKILHPPSRLTKIGVRPDWQVAILGDIEADFAEELRAAVKAMTIGRVGTDLDAVFVSVSSVADTRRVASAKSAIKPDGAVWIVRPKGSADVSEGVVMAAGKAAGLVDVKVIGFSETHSALKFVIPLKDRRRS